MSFRPKLLALDLDGTLLDSGSSLTPRTVSVLRRAMDSGIKVVAATGRMYPSAIPIVRVMGKESPCVFYNGAVIREPATGRTLFKKEIDEEMTAEVTDFFRGEGWYLQRYSNDGLYVVDDADERCVFYVGIAKVAANALGKKFWTSRGVSTKLLGISKGAEDFPRMVELTKERFAHKLYVASSWGRFVEMANLEVNKARSVAKVASSMGISAGETLAIGDSYNDMEMIKWAGVGIAMGNATDEVKAAADETAADNDHDGAARVIEKYL